MKKTLNLFQKFNYISNHIIAKRMRKLLANPTKNTFNMQNMVIVIYIYIYIRKDAKNNAKNAHRIYMPCS